MSVLFILLVSSSLAGAFQPFGPLATHTISRLGAVALPAPIPLSPVEEKVDHRSSSLDERDQWIARLDYKSFGEEVAALGKELQTSGGQADVDHLDKIVGWRNIAAVIGLATVWLPPNPVSIVALSTWTYASWTMIAHHTCHGGYNRMNHSKYNSRGFAIGSLQRRVEDWLDWMSPEAWSVEHNRLHHYRLNEISGDPDLVQRNLSFLRDATFLPMTSRFLAVGLFLPIWKWFYYAPNTFKELQISRWKQDDRPLPKEFDADESATLATLLRPANAKSTALRQVVRPLEFFSKVLAPFLFVRFLFIPAILYGVAGPTFAVYALANLVMADVLSNIHGFITIVTNHAGEDLYTFTDAVKPKSPSFYVRQIVGSANYDMGNDITDFSHGWLNYRKYDLID